MNTNEKAIDWVLSLDDDEFRELVSQSLKARVREPEKWELLLDQAVIEDTLDALDWFIGKVELQAADPARYPRAAGFLERMRGYRTDAKFTLVLRGEG